MTWAIKISSPSAQPQSILHKTTNKAKCRTEQVPPLMIGYYTVYWVDNSLFSQTVPSRFWLWVIFSLWESQPTMQLTIITKIMIPGLGGGIQLYTSGIWLLLRVSHFPFLAKPSRLTSILIWKTYYWAGAQNPGVLPMHIHTLCKYVPYVNTLCMYIHTDDIYLRLHTSNPVS